MDEGIRKRVGALQEALENNKKVLSKVRALRHFIYNKDLESDVDSESDFAHCADRILEPGAFQNNVIVETLWCLCNFICFQTETKWESFETRVAPFLDSKDEKVVEHAAWVLGNIVLKLPTKSFACNQDHAYISDALVSRLETVKKKKCAKRCVWCVSSLLSTADNLSYSVSSKYLHSCFQFISKFGEHEYDVLAVGPGIIKCLKRLSHSDLNEFIGEHPSTLCTVVQMLKCLFQHDRCSKPLISARTFLLQALGFFSETSYDHISELIVEAGALDILSQVFDLRRHTMHYYGSAAYVFANLSCDNDTVQQAFIGCEILISNALRILKRANNYDTTRVALAHGFKNLAQSASLETLKLLTSRDDVLVEFLRLLNTDLGLSEKCAPILFETLEILMSKGEGARLVRMHSIRLFKQVLLPQKDEGVTQFDSQDLKVKLGSYFLRAPENKIGCTELDELKKVEKYEKKGKTRSSARGRALRFVLPEVDDERHLKCEWSCREQIRFVRKMTFFLNVDTHSVRHAAFNTLKDLLDHAPNEDIKPVASFLVTESGALPALGHYLLDCRINDESKVTAIVFIRALHKHLGAKSYMELFKQVPSKSRGSIALQGVLDSFFLLAAYREWLCWVQFGESHMSRIPSELSRRIVEDYCSIITIDEVLQGEDELAVLEDLGVAR